MKKSIAVLFLALGLLFQSQNGFAQAPKKHKPQVGDIQDEEIERIDRRVKSRQFTSIGFGPFASSTSNDGNVMYGLSYGRTWEATERAEIRFDILGAANADSQFFDMQLGYGFLPFTGDVSPLIGAELGGGAAAYKKGDESKSAAGFGGGLLAGVRLFRTADTQLELLATYHAVFAGDTPGVYGAQLRILY